MGLFFMSKKEKMVRKCENCEHILSSKDTERPFCPECGARQSLEKRLAVRNFSNGIDTQTIIKAKCPECGCEDAFTYDCEYFYSVTCSECGTEISCSYEGKIIPPVSSTPEIPTVECPYCHSTNTKKISTLSKAGSVALFGYLAAGKVSKQWHCNNCKSDF